MPGSDRRRRTWKGWCRIMEGRREKDGMALPQCLGRLDRPRDFCAGRRRRLKWSGERGLGLVREFCRCGDEVQGNGGRGKFFGGPEVRFPECRSGGMPNTKERQQQPDPWSEDEAAVALGVRSSAHFFPLELRLSKTCFALAGFDREQYTIRGRKVHFGWCPFVQKGPP
jgi:hypothetical protein